MMEPVRPGHGLGGFSSLQLRVSLTVAGA
jgi:hypothetical protein